MYSSETIWSLNILTTKRIHYYVNNNGHYKISYNIECTFNFTNIICSCNIHFDMIFASTNIDSS